MGKKQHSWTESYSTRLVNGCVRKILFNTNISCWPTIIQIRSCWHDYTRTLQSKAKSVTYHSTPKGVRSMFTAWSHRLFSMSTRCIGFQLLSKKTRSIYYPLLRVELLTCSWSRIHTTQVWEFGEAHHAQLSRP